MEKLTKKLKCISLRNGIEIWIEEDRVLKLQEQLKQTNKHLFVEYEGRTLNTADMIGIFLPADIEIKNKMKRGQWQDVNGDWRDKFEKVDEEKLLIDNILKKHKIK